MAQLSDDCFAFGGPLLPVEEVERLIRARIMPVAETEEVALHAAPGRVLARAVMAPVPLPPFDNSAVDGYVVRHADLNAEGETRLTSARWDSARRSASLPARRSPLAPTRCSCRRIAEKRAAR
jgi:molybdopterin molybdotransferase